MRTTKEKVIKFITELASLATQRVCDDLTDEELKTFKSLNIIREDEEGIAFISDALYQSDIVQWFSERKWFSEEEIKKTINECYNGCPEIHKGMYAMFCDELLNKLFGDKK